MPTYEYECQKCGHRFEEFQSMKDKLLTKCPKCRGKVKRLIGAGAGLLFKGSGFYITDYRSSTYQEKKRKESSSDPGSGPGGGSGSSSGSDSGSGSGSGSGSTGGGGKSEGKAAKPDSGKPAGGSASSKSDRASGDKSRKRPDA